MTVGVYDDKTEVGEFCLTLACFFFERGISFSPFSFFFGRMSFVAYSSRRGAVGL